MSAREPLSGVPRRLLEPGAVEAARRIADPRLTTILQRWGGSSGLLLLGPTGAGKSLSLALASRRLAAGRLRGFDLPKVTWFRADELTRGGREMVSQAKRAEVAVLDELGWEYRTDVVLEVIGARYDAGKVTAATSGQNLGGFLKRYGDAILRRLIEVGGGSLVNVWEPIRGQLPLTAIGAE